MSELDNNTNSVGTESTPPAPPKKSFIKKYLWLIILLSAVAVLAALIFTHVICLFHEYSDATCTDPKTCVYCGKTEGSALGHEWKDATCTEPETCSRCGETGKSALGHNPGEWSNTTDVIKAIVKSSRKCTRCGTILDNTTNQITSFILGSIIGLTPKQLAERINNTLPKGYTAYAEPDSDGNITIYVDDSKEPNYYAGKIIVLDGDGENITSVDSTNLSKLVFGIYSDSNNYMADHLLYDLEGILLALVPTLDKSDAFDICLKWCEAADEGDTFIFKGYELYLEEIDDVIIGYAIIK